MSQFDFTFNLTDYDRQMAALRYVAEEHLRRFSGDVEHALREYGDNKDRAARTPVKYVCNISALDDTTSIMFYQMVEDDDSLEPLSNSIFYDVDLVHGVATLRLLKVANNV